MTKHIFDFPTPFLTKKRKAHIALVPVAEKDFKGWLKGQDKAVKALVKETGFGPKGAQILPVRGKTGAVTVIYVGVHSPQKLYDFSKIAAEIGKVFSKDFLKTTSFGLEAKGWNEAEKRVACIGWSLGAYEFSTYKKSGKIYPALLWPAKMDKKGVLGRANAIHLLRSLINTPANDMGPDALEKVARRVAKDFEAKIKVIKGDDLLKQNFPLVHMVGRANDRAPRLIDITWGKASHPKVTIVGKGVAFDTGGLNIKPTQYMALMKKDMGGAAHALGAAYAIMALNLPIRLRVIIPAVENSISANAFRPGDVSASRKGLTVENTNTDAEGRLILADALTYACEDKPELVIDFATLTGSARAALGQDIPAMFSNDDKIGEKLEKLSFAAEDPVWRMPLWQGYQKLIQSDIADLHNSAGPPGDLIYSALFLERFVAEGQKWVHLDCFAWEPSGKPGRPKGGKDTGMRAIVTFLEETYKR